MKRWQRRSLRLRLALWFTVVASVILSALTPVVYGLIEHRLHIEFGRELRIDWDLVQSHLEADAGGRIRWRAEVTAAGDPARTALWFDVWSDTKELLLQHWPAPEEEIGKALPAPHGQAESFYTVRLENGEARAIERPAYISGRTVILRVFRDESGLHRTLQEILIGFALGVPLAAVLAALGGYIMAGRTLAPVSAMAEQVRQITSESLSQRLPNPNPHDELGQMATVFNQTLQRLQDSFEALRRFTADASHELRTPLTALRAVGEVTLRNSSDPSALRETIGSMLEEAQRLNDLIDSLLALARVESGRTPLHLEAVPLDGLLSELRESVDVLAAEKQQTIELAGEAGVIATADRRLTGQAVMNILHNAIRYSPAGRTVRVRYFRREDRAIIEIADEGPGIAPEYHEKIFERFFRLDHARSRSEGGAGLGLAIARLSVEQQHGAIELESELGKGSRFRIVLPRDSSIPKRA